MKSGAYNATNLLFRGGHLYAHIPECSQIEPLTGNVVLKLGNNKRSCARFTGCPDALFHRGSISGGEGTTRFDLYTNLPTVIHAFRPPCNDGIIPAGGLLHVTPWDCDCNLQLMGTIALCSAGDFRFGRPAVEAERLESHGKPQARFAPAANDWTTYRADPQRSSSTAATVPAAIAKTWERQMPKGLAATPPTAAGGLLFLAGDDGIVRALDATTGRPRWTFATAGPVRIPPSIGGAMAYVGSADGYVYALEAATGRLVWRFRAAPVERRIMVFGKLCSTWPVNSGALVLDGVVYAAAGLINYDGTHVYALDAATGRIKWQNNTSGHLNKDLHEGVSAQGDIAVCGRRLLLAGGNVTSPGAFDLDTGKCLNPPPGTGRPGANSGSFVCGFLGKHPMVGGRRLFTDDADSITNWKRPYDVLAANDSRKKLASGFHGRVPPAFGRGVVATSPWQGSLLCYAQDDVERWIKAPKPNLRGKPYPRLKPRWTAGSIRSCAAIVIAGNAVLAAGRTAGGTDLGGTWSVQAFGLTDGKRLWAAPLPAEPLPNGLLINSAGRIFAVLTSGQIVCLAAKQ